MLRFVSGFVMGIVAGTTFAAFAAGVFGEGYLRGWSVTNKDGAEVCSEPYVWTDKKELQRE